MVSSQHIVTLGHVTNARKHLLSYIVSRPLCFGLHGFTHHVLDALIQGFGLGSSQSAFIVKNIE